MRIPLSILAFSLLAALPAAAQTPPAPTTTFTAAGPAAWGTASNWNSGAGPVPTSTSHALIGAGNTATMTQANATTGFGSLTLGVGSTVQFSASSNTGFNTNANLYLNGQSTLQYTAGSSNKSNNFYVIDSGTSPATYNLGSTVFFYGNLYGSGDLDVIMNTNVSTRLDANSYSGDVRYLSNNGSARSLTFGNFVSANAAGSGTMTLGNGVYASSANDRIHDSGSLHLIGSGSSGYKWRVGAIPGDSISETIANLTIESPTGSNPYFVTGNSGNAGRMHVTNTVTFQGTAGQVDIRNDNGGSFSGAKRVDTPDISCGIFNFTGTGTWNITGSRTNTTYDYDLGTLGLEDGGNIYGGSILTVSTDTKISASLRGEAGFSKTGSATLTVTGDITQVAGLVIAEQGELAIAGMLDGIMIAAGASLNVGASDTAGDTLNPTFPGGFIVEDGTTFTWQYNGATTAGTDYDTIIADEFYLTGLTSITINGESLGYEAQVGDSFVLFQGTVTGFDAGIFTLNMPTLTTGEWIIEKVGSSLRLTVVDYSDPTLDPADIVDDQGGADVDVDTLVTYTVTFSKDIDASTVTSADFSNAGSSDITIGTISETSPGVFTVQVTPTTAGSLQLQVPSGAVITDNAANALDTTSAIVDDTTITVNEPAAGGYAGWTAGPFLGTLSNTDAAVDFDNGGYATGLEWVLGGDPTDPTDDAGLRPVFNSSGATSVTFTFRRAVAARDDPNTAIEIEYGSDMSFTSTATHGTDGVTFAVTGNPEPGVVELITVTIPKSLATGNKLFVRLKVTVTTPP